MDKLFNLLTYFIAFNGQIILKEGEQKTTTARFHLNI